MKLMIIWFPRFTYITDFVISSAPD
ncbi:hypothetical protein KL86CLO1_11208 [uncultured Eubacteriales bacterium]|uniref:Uncharacterized protein n=1 Tax=uncultured Eubacteriales bacterium TaxID=172733 RepID=A0A212JJ89_9FIRM|nr:hypothetical protein KL86CLO1_11208 [uncultured Eubacteriales bacterium]